MKIGILSYPINNNYGCHLQTYALYTVIKRMGHDVTYINRRPNKPTLIWWAKKILKNVLSMRSPFFTYENYIMRRKGKNMMHFFEENIKNQTTPIYTSKGLESLKNVFDAIVVGSDQVWRPEILSDVRDYYLDFLGESETRRISYAASFGTDMPSYTPSLMMKCGGLLEKFHAVSVREKSGLNIIDRFNWIANEPKVVLDPTFLLSKTDYQRFYNNTKKNKTVFCYILDNSVVKSKICSDVSKSLKLSINSPLKNSKNYDYVYPSVGEWLSGIAKSDFVVTDSFHGTVFAIIFEIPFLVIVNSSRGASRFQSLLEGLGLQERILSENQETQDILRNTIDWVKVKDCLYREREKSVHFLKEALS